MYRIAGSTKFPRKGCSVMNAFGYVVTYTVVALCTKDSRVAILAVSVPGLQMVFE